MKKILVAILTCIGVVSAMAQPITDTDLRKAMDACAAHQENFSVGDNPTSYKIGWEHCEVLRREFLRRRDEDAAALGKDLAKRLQPQ